MRPSGFPIIHFISRTVQMRNGVPLAHLIIPRTFKLVSFPLQHLLPQVLDKPSLQDWRVLRIPEPCNHRSSFCCWKNGHDPLGMAPAIPWMQKEQQCHRAELLHTPQLSCCLVPAFLPPHGSRDNGKRGQGRACFHPQAGSNDAVSMVISHHSFCMKYVVFCLIDISGGHSIQ